jgi:hypothetical protein
MQLKVPFGCSKFPSFSVWSIPMAPKDFLCLLLDWPYSKEKVEEGE